MTCPARHRHHGTPCTPNVCRAALAAMCADIEQRRRERSEAAAFVIWPTDRRWGS